MKISIIGSGWVGTLLGKSLKAKENDVIFYDISENRIEELKKEGSNATLDLNEAVKNSELSFITVPTPEKNGKIDLSFIKSASEKLGTALKNKEEYHVIVVKSTVVPGTTESVVKYSVEKNSGKEAGKDFGLCMNPEFLTQIHNSWSNNSTDQRTPDTEERIVIGEYDSKSGDILENVYKPFSIPIFRVDLKTAEFIKYAHNLCLASKISYWNEIFLIAKEIGVDSDKVAEIVSMDKRIGKYGSVHGKAFAGTCFPKDLRAFIYWAKQYKDPTLLEAVEKINEYMKKNYGVRE